MNKLDPKDYILLDGMIIKKSAILAASKIDENGYTVRMLIGDSLVNLSTITYDDLLIELFNE